MPPRRVPPLLFVLAVLLHHSEERVLMCAIEVVKGAVLRLHLKFLELTVALIEVLLLLLKWLQHVLPSL